MVGPLEGIKVLEMANFISGPYAAMLLADLGAETTKVEQPGSGDPFRGWGDREGNYAPQFAAYNRNKKSVSINIQTESGKALYRRLAERADVIIENFRPGTADRLGIGYDSLKVVNPGLVYCSMTGLGSVGPDRNRPTYDAIGTAMSGLWSVLTDVSDPHPIGPPMIDQLTGLYSAYAVLGALVARGRTGQGQFLEVSMLSAGLSFMTEPIANYLLGGEISHQSSRPRRSQSYAFVASDGLPFAIHLSSPPKFWEGLTRSVGHPEFIEDSRFKTKTHRVRNYDVVHQTFADIFRTQPRAHWLAILAEHDVPSAPINNVAEAIEHPQAQAIGMVKTFGTDIRPTPLVGFPAAYASTPCSPDLPPPLLGEHNQDVLLGLGYSSEDLARFRREGTI